MWVDPGEVMVKICRPSQRPVDEVLWKQELRPVRPPPSPVNKLASPLRAPRPTSPSHHTEQFWQEQVARRRSPSPPLVPQQPQPQPQLLTRPYSPQPNQMYHYSSSPPMLLNRADRFSSQQQSWSSRYPHLPGVQNNSGELMWEGRETLIQA